MLHLKNFWEESFGGFLEDNGFVAVPSPMNPGRNGNSYFRYDTCIFNHNKTHLSFVMGIKKNDFLHHYWCFSKSWSWCSLLVQDWKKILNCLYLSDNRWILKLKVYIISWIVVGTIRSDMDQGTPEWQTPSRLNPAPTNAPTTADHSMQSKIHFVCTINCTKNGICND